MREVSARAVRAMLEVLEAAGIPFEPLLARLAFRIETLRDPAARIDWEPFVALVEGVEEICRDALSLEEIGARMLRVPSFQFLRLAGQLVVSPRQLYTVAVRLVAPAMFSNITVTNQWLPAGRLIVTAARLGLSHIGSDPSHRERERRRAATPARSPAFDDRGAARDGRADPSDSSFRRRRTPSPRGCVAARVRCSRWATRFAVSLASSKSSREASRRCARHGTSCGSSSSGCPRAC